MRVLGFGHPLLDIMSHVDKEYLKKFSIEIGSVNLAEPPQLPIFEEMSQRRDVEFVPGGASMNTIRVVRWMSGVNNIAGFVGCLGDDEFGCILERALSKAGVESSFQRQEDKPTGTCACLIVDKERSLLANLGAAVELSMDHMQSSEVTAAIAGSQLFYCEGFFLNTISSPQNSVLIGKHAAAENKYFTFNLSAPYLCHIFKDRWVQVLPYVDILFGSKIDALAFAEANQWEETDLRLVMQRLCILPKVNPNHKRIVVITDGADATFVATKDEVEQYIPPHVPADEIVDTNGAGDAFVGGFLSQFIYGREIATCVHAGHLAAGEIIRNNGCTFRDTPPIVTPPPPARK